MIGVATYQSRRAAEVIIGLTPIWIGMWQWPLTGKVSGLARITCPRPLVGTKNLSGGPAAWDRSARFGIEGTGSYGAGVTRFLADRSYTVIEVNRPDRSVRYRKGKSDPTDAEMAARGVLSGVADATPKSGEGEVEMIRMLRSARDSAVKARTQAGNQMKALVVTAPAKASRDARWSHYQRSHEEMQELSVPHVWTIPRPRQSTLFVP